MRQVTVIAAALLISTSALAQEMPARKAGLWDMKMTFDSGGMPPQTMKQCIDAATDKAMQSQFGGAGKGDCSKQEVKKTGNTITVDSVCKTGPSTTTSRAVITGSFDSGYTMKITSKSDGPAMPGMPPGGQNNMTIEAKHVGACQAGQRPGDVIMAGGIKMNVLDMQKMGAGAGGMMAPPVTMPPGAGQPRR